MQFLLILLLPFLLIFRFFFNGKKKQQKREAVARESTLSRQRELFHGKDYAKKIKDKNTQSL